uniref:Uncharacterized protein n=1 Tax=Cannabis sativa TaxID=3483 RepID=A0A803P582_CANSA
SRSRSLSRSQSGSVGVPGPILSLGSRLGVRIGSDSRSDHSCVSLMQFPCLEYSSVGFGLGVHVRPILGLGLCSGWVLVSVGSRLGPKGEPYSRTLSKPQ